jgi:membrane-associated PAP2 superfamily phosphatase
VRRDALVALAGVVAFVAVTAALAAGGWLVDVDLAVREWADAHRPAAVEAVGRVLNRLGQGGALLGVSIGLACLLGLVRWHRGARWRSLGGGGAPQRGAGGEALWPLLYVLAALALVYPLVRVGKDLTARGAPNSPWPPEQAVALMGPQPPGGYAAGYPGGHAVNTIVWYGVLLLLFTALRHAYDRAGPPRGLRLAIRIGVPVVVATSNTYLSFHWLTDNLAGLALGIAIDRVLNLLWRRFGGPGGRLAE